MDLIFWLNFAIEVVGSIGGGAIIYGIFCHFTDKHFKTGKYAEEKKEIEA